MTTDAVTLQEEINSLAQQFFGSAAEKHGHFVNWLQDTFASTWGKEFLLIHNPGGWGSTRLEHCLDWERSIVTGVSDTMDRLGRRWALVQYFRSGNTAWQHIREAREELVFFFGGKYFQAKVMAACLRFLTQQIRNLRIILVGASQGAAFSNAVMRELGDFPQVYSIELGIFFPHMSRRVITERTLAIDSNGLMPDSMAHRDLRVAFPAYAAGLFRWCQYWFQGKPTEFARCTNLPGHEYRWEYPEVRHRIEDFLAANFGAGQK